MKDSCDYLHIKIGTNEVRLSGEALQHLILILWFVLHTLLGTHAFPGGQVPAPTPFPRTLPTAGTSAL